MTPSPYLRLALEVPFLIIVVALLAYFLSGSISTEAMLGVAALYVTAAFLSLAWYAKFQDARIAADTSLLQGALWDLVRGMENTGIRNASRRAADRAQLLERFAVEGAKAVGAGKPMPMGDVAALDITTLGFELITRNEADSGDHWRKVNAIRRGCYAFLMLVELRNPSAAYLALCTHMQKQRDVGKGMDNFTELKALLGLPIEYPEGDMPERCIKAGITLERERAALNATTRGMARVYDGLVYAPWPVGEESAVTYVGPEILQQMRIYMR